MRSEQRLRTKSPEGWLMAWYYAQLGRKNADLKIVGFEIIKTLDGFYDIRVVFERVELTPEMIRAADWWIEQMYEYWLGRRL